MSAFIERQVIRDLLTRLDQPPPPAPWTGSFLPTDEAAAEIETQIRRSEDHAISAGTVFAGPSRRWGGTSTTGFSTRQARSSGRP